ncbi:MAG: M23 family metallopeptidase [Bacilli bacterium]|nr:M23 family metallopeptidase [Bacilli bacterium]
MNKIKRRFIIIKLTTLLGLFSVSIGIMIQFHKSATDPFKHYDTKDGKMNFNLNLKEIDTYYENNSSIEYISYVDTSWRWPTDCHYNITNHYQTYHPAVDIVTTSDLHVYSAYSGEVITDSYKYDNGNYLVIKQDNNYYVLYAHLSQKLVHTGEKVEKGQVIGIMGNTGMATGIHLHFSVWEGYPHNSKSINPFEFY